MHQLSTILKNVSVSVQGRILLNNISFQINKNEQLLITGASGSGKTILAKAFAEKLSFNGEITFNKNGVEIKPTITLVEQHYNFNQLSNDRVFYYQQRYSGFDTNEAITISKDLSIYPQEKVAELLQQFNLQQHKNSPLQQLSSGEYKKSQLVKALLQQPDMLILDEPFVGLDIYTRQQLQLQLDNLIKAGVKIIIICQPRDIPSFVTHVAMLEKGKLIAFSKIDNTEIKTAKNKIAFATYPVPPYHVAENFSYIVRMQNVSVRYGEAQILKQINWEVKQGEKWLLSGPNGAGKSTLLSLINADNPQAYLNDITLFDKRRGTGESIWDIKKNIGYVSPELQWYFDINTTIFQAIASGLFDTIGLTHQLNTVQQSTVNNWIESFGLTNYKDRLFSTLSAGQQRLVLLARAAVKNPPLLILDEPCQGLDEQQKAHFLHLVDTICQNSHCTLIYVSHYNNEIPCCINYMLELNSGHGTITTFNTNKTILQPTIKTKLETA